MKEEIKNIIFVAVTKMIENVNKDKKLNKLTLKHKEKTHFIPFKYRIFGGILQSLNIQFGNFIEELMTLLISRELKNDKTTHKYEIISEYSGQKRNNFSILKVNEKLIQSYIDNCQTNNEWNIDIQFPILMKKIIDNNEKANNNEKYYHFQNDIDLLFRNKETNKIYYIEMKYNDDHDTGKFININEKFIKTYAFLTQKFNSEARNIVPILFYFTNKKLKGNNYVPEKTNIRRGKKFFDDFLTISYDELDKYLSNLGENVEIIKIFDSLYNKIVKNLN